MRWPHGRPAGSDEDDPRNLCLKLPRSEVGQNLLTMRSGIPRMLPVCAVLSMLMCDGATDGSQRLSGAGMTPSRARHHVARIVTTCGRCSLNRPVSPKCGPRWPTFGVHDQAAPGLVSTAWFGSV